jgi:hypothetical protein
MAGDFEWLTTKDDVSLDFRVVSHEPTKIINDYRL